ncbi:mitochondrial GTPase 1-like protein [Thermochaetoides thermophila DSM 1495]|uniref:Mitochondrial GTPase 1-like protein n=1 Tax=Chaetomium thermophilum (strain DSM 1495 / CBS 144.50 / IMI 039719) TaxID=759272 RepID=G0S1F2_CHATD|nr:mitochondrial GTPase 1-like protein [Thermochaetoides thermophila DSM 1495]EGS22862.1 mitochondrial GTPase 1-like protein [Thermochaetoides thermophila DSM 1495]
MATPPTTSSASALARTVSRAGALMTAGSVGFTPRTHYEVSLNIPRSYYLGHHHAGLNKMRQSLTNVGLIIECRDFRLPITSWNPLIEQSLGCAAEEERARIIVYTKRDLAPDTEQTKQVAQYLREFYTLPPPNSGVPYPPELRRHAARAVLFLGSGRTPSHSSSLSPLLEIIKHYAISRDSLTGLRCMVVGMPNAGKSTLLNRLRGHGMGRFKKAAQTGAQPGVTRKLGTPVRILPGEDMEGGEPGLGEGVFVVDTPGVFIPYVSDPEAMVKLALVGCVKDGIVPKETLADYLLEGGKPNLEAAAEWVVQEWRRGDLGKVVLDEVTPETLVRAVAKSKEEVISLSQARKREKLARLAKREQRFLGLAAPDDF